MVSGRNEVIPSVIKRLTPSQFESLVELWKTSDGVILMKTSSLRDRMIRLVGYGYATKTQLNKDWSPRDGKPNQWLFKITNQGRWRLLEPMKLLEPE